MRLDAPSFSFGPDANKTEQAIAAAQRAIKARLDFWDGVLAAMQKA
jgi:hypothetical protein